MTGSVSAHRIPAVGIDARGLSPAYKAHYGRGTWRYLCELLRYLPQMAEESGVSIQQMDENYLRVGSVASAISDILPFGRMTFLNQLNLPLQLGQRDVDLFHFISHGDAPAFFGGNTVVTVLDLIPQIFPELYSRPGQGWRFKFARYLENRAARTAASVIVISEATKRDVHRLLDVPLERIHVTPLAVSENFGSRVEFAGGQLPEMKKELRQDFGLNPERPVLLYLGGIDRRKNVPFLLDVLGRLKEEPLPDQQKPQLVLAGRIEKDDQYPALLKRISELDLTDDVVLLGFVADDRLRDLYWAADIFMFPSRYEGFGLPLLEAMACGVPVLAENNSSLPEVVADPALLLRGFVAEQWAGEVKQLLACPERAEMIARAGVAHAARFSWRATAAATLEVYTELLDRRRG
ncbi:MAG: glycosyltransferase family 1 protein [bacterium]|nr:glycosyltransferase family 1 protein [bacterium]